MRQLFLLMVLGMLLVLVALTADCTVEHPLTFEENIIEVVDTVYIHQVYGFGPGVCAICDSTNTDSAEVFAVRSFAQCSTAAAFTAKNICAYTEYWKY